jgi:hypothetical protein
MDPTTTCSILKCGLRQFILPETKEYLLKVSRGGRGLFDEIIGNDHDGNQ